MTAKRLPRSDLPVGMSVMDSKLLIGLGGSSPLGAPPFPRQVLLDCIRKLAKHEAVGELSWLWVLWLEVMLPGS